MEQCPDSVGVCALMRTCPCCKRVLGHRSGLRAHERACEEALDVAFAQAQHEHWQANHDHRREQARRRLRRR
jgi:hypothetical protein